MANDEHVKKLEEGVKAWNTWRKEHPDIEPDLSETVRFKGMRLVGVNLERANLEKVNFEETDLCGANLKKANLCDANLTKAKLCLHTRLNGANLSGAWLQEAELGYAKLRKVNFRYAHLEGAVLQGAKLQGADLYGANITGANLQDAKLKKACVEDIIYDQWTKCKGIRIEKCIGNPIFKRFAQKQDYLENFKQTHTWLYRLWWFSSDCGQSLARWSLLSGTIVLLFGSVYAQYELPDWLPSEIQQFLYLIQPHLSNISRTKFTPYYFSIVTFTTLGFGDITPLDLAGEIWVTIEVIIGYIMLGGLVSILSTKLSGPNQ